MYNPVCTIFTSTVIAPLPTVWHHYDLPLFWNPLVIICYLLMPCCYHQSSTRSKTIVSSECKVKNIWWCLTPNISKCAIVNSWEQPHERHRTVKVKAITSQAEKKLATLSRQMLLRQQRNTAAIMISSTQFVPHPLWWQTAQQHQPNMCATYPESVAYCKGS